jgi:hypothetical protein
MQRFGRSIWTFLARELGCDTVIMKKAFSAVAIADTARKADANKVLQAYARVKVKPVRREYVEQSYGVLALAVKGLALP